MSIHPTAIIDPGAEIDASAEIGPFCVIESNVSIGPGCQLGPYVHIQGTTIIGPNNRIGTGCTLGHPPQHTGYKGAPTRLEIGEGNSFREYVSIHRGFEEGAATRIGNGCFLMGFSHVGHDCNLGNGVIIANGALLAGHVSVGDRAFISGTACVHQFCRIGKLVMVSGGSGVGQDIPPFMIAEGTRAFIRSLNMVGLSRAGYTAEQRAELKRLYKQLYRSGKSASEVIDTLDKGSLKPEALELIQFYESSKRGVAPFAPYHRERKSS